MKRLILPERENWQKSHKDIGFDYFNLPSRDGSIYWSEGVAYEFSLKQIEQLEDEIADLRMDFYLGEIVEKLMHKVEFNSINAKNAISSYILRKKNQMEEKQTALDNLLTEETDE